MEGIERGRMGKPEMMWGMPAVEADDLDVEADADEVDVLIFLLAFAMMTINCDDLVRGKEASVAACLSVRSSSKSRRPRRSPRPNFALFPLLSPPSSSPPPPPFPHYIAQNAPPHPPPLQQSGPPPAQLQKGKSRLLQGNSHRKPTPTHPYCEHVASWK